MKKLLLLILAGLVLTFFQAATVFGDYRQAGNHPIIETFFDGPGLLLGGSIDGKWVNVDPYKLEAESEEQVDLELARGGEIYKLYGFNRYIGTVRGAKPVLYSTVSEWIGVTASPSPAGQYIGIAGQWNAMPRPIKPLTSNNPVFKKTAGALLKKHGLGKAPAIIQQLINVDLDGDKQQETIMVASNINPYMTPERYQRGTYSIVLVQKMVKGKPVNLVLKERYYLKNAVYETAGPDEITWTQAFTVPYILDANGDGKMEVFVKEHYFDGTGMEIYELQGNGLKAVVWGSNGG